MPTEGTGKVPAVDRAFAVLELLARSSGGVSVSTVARRLKAPKSSIHLIMAALEDRGYLRKELPSHKYFVGLGFTALSRLALESIELGRSHGPMAELAAKTGLTVHMAVLMGGEAVLIDRVQPPAYSEFGTWVGQRMHLHCTAVGKVLLAYLSDEDFNRTLQGRRLVKHNHRTICSAVKLRIEMAKIRDAGYSMDDEEEEVGVRCIGAPIFDQAEKVIAAISLAGTTDQIPLEQVEHYSGILIQSSIRISHNFGYRA
jgi:DNA-binding IclR family transcriptional regulator